MLKKYKIEIFIFVLALVLRLAVVGLVSVQEDINFSQFAQSRTADGYYEIAYNMVHNNIYSHKINTPIISTSIRTPGYPLIIALFIYFFKSIWLLLIIQIIIGSLLPLLGRKISINITNNNKVSNLVGVLLAIEPMGIWLSLMILSETFYTFFLFLFILIIFKFLRMNKDKGSLDYKITALAGAILGIATLIRPTTYYLPLILLVAWAMYRFWTKQKILLKQIIIFLATFIIILSPWLYRNYRVFGVASLSSLPQDVLFCYLAPSVLAVKNNQEFTQAQTEFFNSNGVFNFPTTSLSNAGIYQGYAIDTLKQNKLELIQISGISLLTFFTHDGVLNIMSMVDVVDTGGLTIRQMIAQPLPEMIKTAKKLFLSPVFFVLLGRIFWTLIAILFFISIICAFIKKRFTTISAFALIFTFYFALTTISNGFAVNARFRFPVNVFILTFAISLIYDIINARKYKLLK